MKLPGRLFGGGEPPAPPAQPATIPPPPPASQHHTEMVRRLQIGGSGVLGVLLLVGLASMIAERSASIEAAQRGQATGPVAAAPVNGSEPLAELGVQPTAEPRVPVVTAPGQPTGPAPVTGGGIMPDPTVPTSQVPDLAPDPNLPRAGANGE